MAKYLVTGGCGFIGSHLCHALIKKGHVVRVLDNLSTGKVENLPAGVELVRGDIIDAELVQCAVKDMDGVFHLAAVASVEKSVSAWAETHRINLTGAIHVFEAAGRCGEAASVPVVYASSAAVYGDNASMPLSEMERPRPITPYGADKLGCELHARVASLLHKTPTTGLRFFNVYGPRQDPNSPYSGVISIFADRMLRGETIKIFGDGGQARDFVYVGDVCRMLVASMTQSSNDARASNDARVLNVCTGRETTILQLARSLAAVLGQTPAIEHLPARPGDIRLSLGDPRLARRTLGFAPETPLGEGLKHTLAYLGNHRQEAA